MVAKINPNINIYIYAWEIDSEESATTVPKLNLLAFYDVCKENHRHSVHYQLYADDIHIFVSFPPNQTQASQALRNLE